MNDHAAPALGQHLLADFHGVSAALLSDPAEIEVMLCQAAAAAAATPIHAHFHHFGPGLGVTGMLLLQESHISIHTWPESGFAAIDIFMCGDAQPGLALSHLHSCLSPQSVTRHQLPRG
ncbi:S-adenosylmethionine decarboxylase [Chitinivorax tropicus]|uniref:S-adenosylmethionine decarboxylase proenzyme n=1 Tax=Chitinivorax tropicus TaxID=714531 RepID=A0A840MI15_9PROT|nr:adenosylmethionine decarboxylase [Chitinivorax tropicus]MBB5017165.1 S-adenosylmethionine decarboxylase [Chitinivorax tropicus]